MNVHLSTSPEILTPSLSKGEEFTNAGGAALILRQAQDEAERDDEDKKRG